MLAAMALSNYRSFHQRQVLDLSKAGRPQRSQILTGPNGAGKTNALRALGQLRDWVLDTAEQPRKRAWEAWAYSNSVEPTKLELELWREGVRYRYNVAFVGDEVLGETLIAFPWNRPRRLFDRRRDPMGIERWILHESLGQTRTQVRKQVRADMLFLGRAGRLGLEAVQPVYRWFRERLLVIEPASAALPRFTLKMLLQPAREERILAYIRQFLPHFDHLQLRAYAETSPSPAPWPIEAEHELEVVYNQGQRTLGVPYQEEAAGIRQLLTLVGPLNYALERGITLVVDELDANLHPSCARQLVADFQQQASGEAQLLFSAHAPRPMAADLFRVSQIHAFERGHDLTTRITRLDAPRARFSATPEHGYPTDLLGLAATATATA